jgi:hypothetical protein
MNGHHWITNQLLQEQQSRRTRELTTRRQVRHADRNRRHDHAR